MLRKLIEINKTGGDEAVRLYFESLSPDDRDKIIREMREIIQKITDGFIEAMKTLVPVVNELSKNLISAFPPELLACLERKERSRRRYERIVARNKKS